MSCLEDIINGDRIIIGVKDFKVCENPESRLYVNQLPGMGLKVAANITPEMYQSGAEFLREATIMAARQVFDEFALELRPYFDFKNIVETRDLKVFNSVTNAVSATERGVIIKRWRSEVARLFVETVYIKPVQDGTITIKVIDGDVTTEYERDVTGNVVNEIRLDHRAESESIKVVFNQSTLETYECSHQKGGGCSSCGGGGKNIYIAGWDGTRETSSCYGVGVKVNVRCYEENVLCSLIPHMYFLMWYKTGILILKERLHSSRLNHITIFGNEKAEALLAEYQAEYKEKYKTLVKSAYEFLRSTKGECISCNNIRYVQTTP